jgi:hypothetical protein
MCVEMITGARRTLIVVGHHPGQNVPPLPMTKLASRTHRTGVDAWTNAEPITSVPSTRIVIPVTASSTDFWIARFSAKTLNLARR